MLNLKYLIARKNYKSDKNILNVYQILRKYLITENYECNNTFF